MYEQLSHFELILDFAHVSEYLWKAANALFELFEQTDDKRLDWVIERSRELLTGRLETVLALLREKSEEKATRAPRRPATSSATPSGWSTTGTWKRGGPLPPA